MRPEVAGEQGLSHRGKTRRRRVFFIALSLPSGHRQKNNTPFRCVVFGDPYGTRTHVTAVKGRCLNHLTNGPYKRRSQKAAPFFGSGTWIRTGDTAGMNRML